ncbi:MAG: glycosyltransferase [Vampirovibrio sp.]|jgi:glycosyltransferase involved in cell wall biosynthesis|nr:glycosyltransferase [Vampirovibrio sp.]
MAMRLECMSKTAAVYYEKDAYGTGGSRLLGRQAAGEGFLKGLVKYGVAGSLFCLAKSEQDFKAFCDQINPWAKAPRKVTWLPSNDMPGIAKAGTLYRPDPDISNLAWQRRFHDQRAYSICGVTHTIASKAMQRVIGELLLAPVQPWDAVICTSQAVKRAYEKIFDDWGDYLVQRMGGSPSAPLQLPVIPLGIDCDVFPQDEPAQASRKAVREQLGIGPDDIMVLFVGRLIFYAKAHPVPMYIALERAAQRTGKKIFLVQAGWFENAKEEAAFKKAPPQFAPSVNHIFLDGRQPDVRQHIWAGADMFVSLSDNIQETFGLTPIEAMASGLPLITTEWDGYQESVNHGVEGFKIPTCIPPVGSGLDIAEKYLLDNLNYSMYIAHPCLATMVDMDACTEAFVTLIEQPELRRQMGENGRRRAREVYDWKHVIAAYEQLWEELAEIRATADECFARKPGRDPHPLCADPFNLFAHYSPLQLSAGSQFKSGLSNTPELRKLIHDDWMSNFGNDMRIPDASVDRLMSRLNEGGLLTAEALLADLAQAGLPIPSEAHFYRTLGYLLKFNLIALAEES